MNTDAIALPAPRRLTWDRVRGAYSGVGYVIAVSFVLAVWWSLSAALPRLFDGQVREFFARLLQAIYFNAFSMIPGPIFVPLVVNLGPRSGWIRIAYLFAAAAPMGWWCLAVGEGVQFGWDLPSLGFAIDGLLSPALVVGICAYHTYSREAADTLLRDRIGSASLTAEQQRARLRLLHAQIEPHFLFNTLSVVRGLARTDRAATIEMLDNLIRYFTEALPQLRGPDVPLAQELGLVKSYLAIYRARMGERLEYEIATPEDLGDVRVPSMVLLTLVENSLKHGLSNDVQGGSIRVSAIRDGAVLRLMVADSGRGLGLREGRGVGLANTRQRLLMMYGSTATLTLKAAEPRGVVASIGIPMQARS